MYATDWHLRLAAKTDYSAQIILPDLLRLFEVQSTLEVGCGNAHWTRAAVSVGVGDYLAVDGPWNVQSDLVIEPSHYLALDLSRPLPLDRRFDMAICLEVAEHLEEKYSNTLIDSLVDSAEIVVFSAAMPLQGGYRHVNEQQASWWRAKFNDRGFQAFDLVRPKHWSDEAIHYWYRQNTFVYVRRANDRAMAAAEAEQRAVYAAPILFDAVHPERYQQMASYRDIQGKRLARKLPVWIIGRLRTMAGG